MSFWLGVSITLNVCQALVFWFIAYACHESDKKQKEIIKDLLKDLDKKELRV